MPEQPSPSDYPTPGSQREIEPNWFTKASQTRIAGIPVPDLAVWFGLLLSILAVYAQTGGFEFVNLDDSEQIYENRYVLTGLTLAGIKWAFTSTVITNWIPLTMLSHMLDTQIFGFHSGIFHLVNVAYHALAAIVLYAAFQRATGARAASAFVAFVFALHPLHVESVAWVTERKDVLSALFSFLAIYAYVRFAEEPDRRRYLWVVLFFVLGLMSKPMVVTLPFVLLLLDFWPLRRLQWPKVLWEKLPLFGIAVAASVLAYVIPQSAGALFEHTPLTSRAMKALLSYMTYLRQTFWPAGLAVYYPYPRVIVIWFALAALLVLSGLTALVVHQWRKRPYLAMGWFWFVGTMLPVSGLIKIGDISHADRYMYIPMVGLSVMLAWGGMDIVQKWPMTKPALAAAATLFCVMCLVIAWRQTQYWENGETLYSRALSVTSDNAVAHEGLGENYMRTPERMTQAIEQFQTALKLRPAYLDARVNLGTALARIDLCGAAIPHFEEALRVHPESWQAYNNLAACHAKAAQYGLALSEFEAALRLKPDYADARFGLAAVLTMLPGRESDAATQWESALRLNPQNVAAHCKLGYVLMSLGRKEQALRHFETAYQLEAAPEIAQVIEQLHASGK